MNYNRLASREQEKNKLKKLLIKQMKTQFVKKLILESESKSKVHIFSRQALAYMVRSA